MAKKRIPSADLRWVVLEELKSGGKLSQGMSLAIVSDERVGWRAVVPRNSRRFLTADDDRRLAALQRRLRLEYELWG